MHFSQLRICSPPLPQFSSHFYDRCAQCWIEWKINFPISIFFELWLIVFKIYGWHTGTFQVGHQPKKKSFKNGQINRKDEQWAETKKKQFSNFFLTYGRFCTKKNWPILGPVPTKDMQTPPPLSFDPVFMDDAECAG